MFYFVFSMLSLFNTLIWLVPNAISSVSTSHLSRCLYIVRFWSQIPASTHEKLILGSKLAVESEFGCQHKYRVQRLNIVKDDLRKKKVSFVCFFSFLEVEVEVAAQRYPV